MKRTLTKLPYKTRLAVSAGDTFRITVRVTDPTTKLPKDLSGGTVAALVRSVNKPTGGTVIATAADESDLANGILKVSIDKATTAAKVGQRGFFSLAYTAAGGDRTTYVSAPFEFEGSPQ